MIPGTLPCPSHDLNRSNSVFFYTNPANASVKLNDTYNTLIIVKHGDHSEFGSFIVELGVGRMLKNISEDGLWTGHNHRGMKLNMTSMDCVSDYAYGISLNIMFDNEILNWNLTDSNKTEISIRFIYRYHKKDNSNDVVDTSSSRAFINIILKDSDPSPKVVEDGCRDRDKITNADNIEEGTTITSQEHVSSPVINKEYLRVVSSSLQLHVVKKFLILFCSLIVLSCSFV